MASMAGLWSSMETGDGEEFSLVFTENSFHHLLVSISQYKENLVYPLQLPSAGWSLSPPLLQVPVCDLDDVRKQIGFIPKADYQPQLLLSLLVELASRTEQVYCQDLQTWFQEH